MLCAFKCPTTSSSGNPPRPRPRRPSPAGSQREPEAAVGVPGKLRQHRLAPQHRCRVGDRPQALPAPHPHRDTWLSPPRAPATPGRPPAPPSAEPRCEPPPRSGPCGDGSAPASLSHPRTRADSPAERGRSANCPPPTGPRVPLQPASRPRDGASSSPPTPAPRRQPRQHQLRRRSRSARSRGRLLPGAPQTKPGRRQHMERRKWRRGPAACSRAAPVNVLLSSLESIFQKSRSLPTPPSPSPLHNVTGHPSQTRVLAVVTSPLGCGGGILSEEMGRRGTRARCSLCPARVELL